MSRSSDLGAPASPLSRLAATALLTTVAILSVAASPARAQPGSPTPGPVVPITAPVVDIRTGTGTVDGSQATEETDRGTRTRLDASVLFTKDSARLRPRARAEIRKLAQQMNKERPGQVTVTGYTDDLGSASHGLRLSKRRAAAVTEELGRHLDGTWPDINVIGRGEADPAVPNTSETNRKLNRRVVIVVRR